MKGQDLFLVLEITELIASNGKPYVALKAVDKTGEMSAKKWDTILADLRSAMSGDVCRIDFSIGEFKGNPDMKFTSLGVVDPNTIDMNDFVKASKYRVDDMWVSFENFLYGFEDIYFKTVAAELFDAKSQDLFKKAPAATKMHHAFVSGLLEHTLQMLECAETLLEKEFFKKTLNRDLCMFGIMFHDFGKIYEYSCEPGFKVRPQGLLVGHIPMVAARIYEACAKYDIPEEVRDHMMHVVLAHHGSLAWGSPNKPACPEAVFVHHVDNLHGSVFGLLQAREAANTETFKYGFGEQQLTVLKKSFDEVMHGFTENGGEEADMDGVV